MNILFIYNNAKRIGGVQTLVARLAEGLIESGHTARCMFFSDISESVLELFPRDCQLLSLPASLSQNLLFPLNCREWVSLHAGDPDVCITFGKSAMQFIAANLNCFKKRPGLVAYIVNDYEHVRSKPKILNRFYSTMFYDKYFKDLLPQEDMYFMSEAVRRIHEEGLDVSCKDSPIMPLPIRLPQQQVQASLRPFRLVSIGGIDSMVKTYNFTTPQILRELLDSGYDIHWDVYGSGHEQDEERFRELIVKYGLSLKIVWHGQLPYSEMPMVLENASAFWGMGTAAIEAAILGIPSIISVASDNNTDTYGFLHELPFGICGESGAYWLKRCSLKKMISELYTASASKYEELINDEREYAKQFEYMSLINQFIKYASVSAKIAAPSFPILWSIANCADHLRARIVQKLNPQRYHEPSR